MRAVVDFGVVDPEGLLRALQKLCQLVSRVVGADNQHLGGRIAHLPRDIGLEEPAGFEHLGTVSRDDAKAAALGVKSGEVEQHHEERAVVDDHELRVIPRQVVAAARHGHAGAQQSKLELAQQLVAAAIGVGDERAHAHATTDGRLERLLDLGAVEAEDSDVDGLLGFLDGVDDGRHAIFGEHQQFHKVLAIICSFSRPTRRRPCPCRPGRPGSSRARRSSWPEARPLRRPALPDPSCATRSPVCGGEGALPPAFAGRRVPAVVTFSVNGAARSASFDSKTQSSASRNTVAAAAR